MPYLGNTRSNEFHDLTRVKPQCQIAEIIAAGRQKAFTPDTLEQALREGFEPCAYCVGTVADLLVGALLPLAAPADLEGRDLGGGEVALRWTYGADISAHQIRFDVYASPDPLSPFRTLRLADHAATEARLSGLDAGGQVHFTVLARRRGQLSLPSSTLRLYVQPVLQPVRLTPGGAGPDTELGLGFPFRIDDAGRVFAQGGDSLLRGKILQLLLTAPGERVNLPEFGTRLRDLVFDPNNDVLAATTEFMVARALRRFLGEQIHVDQVQISADEVALNVDIVYLRKSDLRSEQLRVGIPIPR
jgi:phage baseplate assembly protein W